MGMDDPPAGSLVEDLFQDDAGLEASGRKVQVWTHSTMAIMLVAKNTRRAVATFLQL